MASAGRAGEAVQPQSAEAASPSSPGNPWTDVDDDDDDMDYEDAEEDIEDDMDYEDTEADTAEDAEDGEDGAETEVEMGDTPQLEEAAEGALDDSLIDETTLTIGQLQALFRERQILQVFTRAAGDDDDDGGFIWTHPARRRRAPNPDPYVWPKLPYPEGTKAIREGTFGTNRAKRDTLLRRDKQLAYQTMMRELGLESPGIERSRNRIMRQDMIPRAAPDVTINFPKRGYQGQFSDDGNFFFTCSQDFKVRMYDTSNPYRWRYYKQAPYWGGQWTITDASLSSDNRFLAYSSMRPQVCLANTDPNNNDEPSSLNFADTGNPTRRNPRNHWGYEWAIYSLRFSGDGREIVAGTGDSSIYVYDLEAGHSILRIRGHDDDVNAVCYGDKSSPHILYSGSDDTTIKVWDRRSLGDGREAGVFLGHTEGITYVDSKGDGRYVLSNSKDQTMKLWDLRRMVAPEEAARVDPMKYSQRFDYRYPPYLESQRRANPHDCSLVTFRGHSVCSTLIRCHFSPAGSTDGRYVYSGGHDGCVHVWNMDGTPRAKLDVTRGRESSPSRTRGSSYYGYQNDTRGRTLRDVSWHPFAPIIATTSWNGGRMDSGSTTVHSWNDGVDSDECADPPLGVHVNSELDFDKPLRSARQRGLLRGRGGRTRSGGARHIASDSDDDSDYEDDIGMVL